ncbi:MAG: DUF3891 family protein [Balneolia bacterium]|nr:DUF3891 family protein [Balneolia bacterium]
MIVRDSNSAEALCITQIHHSLMTGELAKAWNADFGIRLPLMHKVIRAAMLHDIGWLDWEGQPGLDSKTEHPHDFLSMPKDSHLGIWQNGFYDSAALDPLVGLLVLRHNVSLAGKDAEKDPAVKAFMDEMDDKDKQLEQLVLSENPGLTAEDLRTMNSLVLLLDYISLRMLMGSSRKNPFGPPPEFGGNSFKLTADSKKGETMLLSPWPFIESKFKWKAQAWRHQRGERFEKLSPSSQKEISIILLPG